jgi:hypothetical protein
MQSAVYCAKKTIYSCEVAVHLASTCTTRMEYSFKQGVINSMKAAHMSSDETSG